jgi:AmiR/NasT family two-component response regulator
LAYQVKPVPPKKIKKAGKGETRKEVEAATRVLTEKRKVSEQGAKKKGVQNRFVRLIRMPHVD